jgi:hypothetical protein
MTPEQFNEFALKDGVTFEGITEDYSWYEADRLRRDMQAWSARFEKVVNVLEARHKEHIKMLQQVMEENRELKNQLKDKP